MPAPTEGWVASDGRSGVASIESLGGGGGIGIAANPGIMDASTSPQPVPPVTGLPPETGAQESVIGSDDRSRVTTTSTYPSRAIGQLTFRTPTGRSAKCTGWLVSTRLVLTSGHCVHNGRGTSNGWYSNMRFYPGRNGGSSPYGSCSADHLATLTGWYSNADPVYDMGALRLNCAMGSTVGWLGFVRHKGLDATTGMAATVRGYPADRSSGTMWTHSGSIAASQTKSLFYRMDSFGGQSGSPVFAYQDPPGTSVTTGEPLGPGYYGLGVHGWGTGRPGPLPCTCNSGPRITQTRVYVIADWIADL